MTAEPKQNSEASDTYGDEVVKHLRGMAGSVKAEAKAAWTQARIWVPLSSMVALATPAAAFIAGFSGLGRLIDQSGVIVWSFVSGLLGVVALWVRKQAETEGTTERLRGAAAYALMDDIWDALARYDAYTKALSLGTPVKGFEDQSSIFQWLCTQRDTFVKRRAALEKFVYKLPGLDGKGA
ncbi:hypothetical protein [Sinomonas sp. G460-2]|uniref:hypothetical protein n=1 Tax=Sinomonas sp. G460-2 TaxID=3393464 RepID=UPI0039EF2534